MSIFSKLLRLPPGGMGRVVVGEKPDNDNKTGIEVTAAIFFDGTGNNRNNTVQRRMAQHNAAHPDAPRYEEEGIPFNPAGYEQHGKNKAGKPVDSYEAGYSNVSILERMSLRRDPPQKDISVYIEGIGTQNNLGDDWKGSAFGMSKTDVKSKVQIGVGRMAANIIEVLKIAPADSFVERMTIDVFGLSYGATAARHFVSLLNDTTPLAARLGIPQAEVEIKFVGVFDTISSVGYGLGFGSDVEELGLVLAGVPQKVVHLTAANEHRKNFSFTDITSSLQAAVGYELVLPDVPANIGGSYGEVWDVDNDAAAMYYQPSPENFVADSGVAENGVADVQVDTQDEDEKYRAAIQAGRIVYTCNAGWIDMTHAFTETRRTRLGVGARSLWTQLTTESGIKSNSPGENGFLVVYRQDAQITSWLPTVGVTRKYFVPYGLSVSCREEIAMAIFQEVSLEFEALQAYGAAIGRGDSSFEPADLISNLLGFYRTVRPALTQERILQLCGKLSIEQSLDILRLYPGTFSDKKYKNKKFSPRFFPNEHCANPVFPAQLRTISPAVKGTDFRDWIDLFDVHGGRPPMYGPKY